MNMKSISCDFTCGQDHIFSTRNTVNYHANVNILLVRSNWYFFLTLSSSTSSTKMIIYYMEL